MFWSVHHGLRVPVFVTIIWIILATLVAAPPAAAKSTKKIERLQQEQKELREREDELTAERKQAEQDQQRLDAEIAEATARLDALEAELAQVEQRVVDAEDKVASIEYEQRRKREVAGDRVRELYKTGASDPVLRLMSGESSAAIIEQSHYLSAVSEQDQTALEDLSATTTRLERQRTDLEADRRELAALQIEVQEANTALEAQFAEAVAAEKRLAALVEKTVGKREKLAGEERELRQEQAAASRASRSVASGSGPAVSSGGKACPQAQPRQFTDTWGAPRSGGRRHQGTDIMGARGGNVYAITSGTVQFTKSGSMSGLFLGLRGDDGNAYWYMHLQDFVAGPGQRVAAGQLIGHNGDTGNARGTSPHIHFEYHPGGGGAANPYPLLRAVCG